jgi:hypothetical protein
MMLFQSFDVSNRHLSSISCMKCRYVGDKYMHFMSANNDIGRPGSGRCVSYGSLPAWQNAPTDRGLASFTRPPLAHRDMLAPVAASEVDFFHRVPPRWHLRHYSHLMGHPRSLHPRSLTQK